MHDNMGSVIVLGVKPEIRFAASAERECFILQVISSVTDPDAVKRSFEGDGTFLLLFPPALFTCRFREIAAFD